MKKTNSVKGKTVDEKAEYLNSLPYSILLKQKKNRFYLILPELSIVSVNANIEEAYKDLHDQKQSLIARYLDCEAEDEIVLPRKMQAERETFHQLKIFIYKLLIVGMLVLLITMSSVLVLNKAPVFLTRPSISNAAISILSRGTKTFIARVEQSIINAPEDVKQERLKKLHQFAVALQPVVYEFQTLFSYDDSEKKLKESSVSPHLRENNTQNVE